MLVLVLLSAAVLAVSTSTKSCTQSATCIPLAGRQRHCLGTVLSYSHTSLDLTNDSYTLEDVQQKLESWSALRGVPRCWQIIQPLLCAVYMPKCNNSLVDLYPRTLCLNVRHPCKVVLDYIASEWPSFLDCEKATHFTTASFCTGETYTKMKFIKNESCVYPLVNTDNEDNFFKDINGCALQCQNPVFTDAEHESVHVFTGIMSTLCLLSTLITLATFLMDWKNANKYPAVIVFFINFCFFVGSIGWMAQFAGPTARNDIVCRGDGTLRFSEPLVGPDKETASCVVVFFIIYYFMLAGAIWFVILAYSWHLSFKKLQSGSVEDKFKGKIAYFHIASWALPLVCTIVTLSIKKVDGDSLSGICFVSYTDNYARGLLVLLPIMLALCASLVFLLQGIIRLFKIRLTSNDVQNNKATAKITATIIRLGLFTILAFVFVLLTFIIHLFEFSQRTTWNESLRNFTICSVLRKSHPTGDDQCQLTSRPSLTVIYLNIFTYFGAGILMSSWTWTKASKETWKRFLRKLFRLPTNKPIKLKSKHKLIAHAFHQKKINQPRKLSLDFHTSHDDPLGMKFDLASVTSQDVSAAWMDAIPKLVVRRGGIALPVAGTLRRYSDSDLSSMVASRRASIDSQFSEVEKTSKSKKRRDGGDHRSHRGLTKINSADIAAFNARRRGSNLSQKDISNMKAHLSRRMSNNSAASNASAHNISLDCEEIRSHYTSRRSSLDDSAAANTQLEELSLATYSLFTATAFLKDQQQHNPKQLSQSSRTGSSNNTRQHTHTPNNVYINGALDDDEVSDISL